MQSPSDFCRKGAKFESADLLSATSNAKFDSPLPEDTESTPSRQPKVSATTANLAEAPPQSPAPVSTRGRSGVGRSSDGHNEHSWIVLPPETGEQPSLSSGLSDAPWLNRRRPGSLYSVSFITAGPITKLFARGGEESGGHVLRETTSRGLCGLVCPSRTSFMSRFQER